MKNNWKTGRIFICFIAVVYIITAIPCFADSTTGCNPEMCATHAEQKYLNSTYGLCAEFASRCLYYSGLSCAYNGTSPRVSCADLRNALIADGMQEYTITLNSDGFAYQSNNTISRGDVIFWKCTNHTNPIYPHAAICQGTKTNDILKYCARNNSVIDHDLKKITCYGCGHICSSIVGFHINPSYYTVRFNGNDNTGGEGPAAIAAPGGGTITLPGKNTMDKTGNHFCYWRSSPTGGNMYLPGTAMTCNGNAKLYAFWYTGLLGDADCDGSVTSTDARLTLQYSIGSISETDLDTDLADFDRDEYVTSTDARLILQVATLNYLESIGGGNAPMAIGGKSITWDDLNWDLLDINAIDWDHFTMDGLLNMLTSGEWSGDEMI